MCRSAWNGILGWQKQGSGYQQLALAGHRAARAAVSVVLHILSAQEVLWGHIHRTPVLKMQRYSENVHNVFKRKQQFLLLHQTSKKASPGNPVRSVLNRTLSPLGRDSSVKSRAVACYFVVCISMDRCQKKIVWLDKLLLFKLKQIFGFINPIFTWKMPSVHYKASDFQLGKKHCSRPSKGKQSEELNLPGAALMTWV